MKKFIPVLVFALVFFACEENLDSISIEADTVISEPVAISVPATSNGGVFNFDVSKSESLSDIIDNIGDVTDIQINELSYTYVSFSGNENGVVNDATLKINNIVVSTILNVSPKQEVDNKTKITITDANILGQLESLLLSSKKADLQLFGNATSNEGTMSFVLELNLDMSVTL